MQKLRRLPRAINRGSEEADGASVSHCQIVVSAQETHRFRQAMASLSGQPTHIRHMKTPSIRNILVSIDFSKMSIQAIETANRLAPRFNAAVHLAHVCDSSYQALFIAPTPLFIPFSVVPKSRG